MKIYKIANIQKLAAVNVPDGYVVLETTIDLATGEVDKRFHRGGKSKCNKEAKSYLKKMSEADIGDTDKLEVTGEGLTQGGWAQHNPVTPENPLLNKPAPQKPAMVPKQKQKPMGGMMGA